MLYRHQISEIATNIIPELESFSHVLIKIEPEITGNGDAWWEANKGTLKGDIEPLKELAETLDQTYKDLGDLVKEKFEVFEDKFALAKGNNMNLSEGIYEELDDLIGYAFCKFLTKIAYLAGVTEKIPFPETEQEREALKITHGLIACKLVTKETY